MGDIVETPFDMLNMRGNKENHNWENLDMASLVKQEVARYMQKVKPATGTLKYQSVNFVHHQPSLLLDFAGMCTGSQLFFFVLLHNDDWIIDTGATSHMCYDKQLFSALFVLDKPIKLILPDGSS